MSALIMDHIGIVSVRFPITWAHWFAQPLGQQGFGTNNLKTKAPALSDQQLDSPAQGPQYTQQCSGEKSSWIVSP